ncbi:MAG: T9SS type A sorting domain-containing protein [Bacteroidales bacterium]
MTPYFSGNNLIIKGDKNIPVENSNLEILDLSGRVLFTKRIDNNGSNRIPVDLPQGVYICTIENTNLTISQKLIKN